MAKKKYPCKECGKVFDSSQALGGQVLNSHRSGDQVGVRARPSPTENPSECEQHEPSSAGDIDESL